MAGGLGGLFREWGAESYIGFPDHYTFGDDNDTVGNDSLSPIVNHACVCDAKDWESVE